MPEVFTDFGARRFNCVCGAKMADGGHALEHFFKHKDVGIEEYRHGVWIYSASVSVERLMLERLREKGEDVEAFVRRIQEWADQLERDAQEG
jgi:hypothetical protein